MCGIPRCVCGCICLGLYGLVYSGAWLCSPSFREHEAEKRRERVEREEKQMKEMKENLKRSEVALAQLQMTLKSRLEPNGERI